MSWWQRQDELICLNRVHVGFIVLIVLNFLFSLSSSVDGKPSRNDDDDHGTYTDAHLSTDQGTSLFDDTKPASPVSVPFVIPTSYNKLRVPKFRNRKPVAPFSTVRKLNDDPKRKPYTTPVPVGQGFAPPMNDSKWKWGPESSGTSNTTTTLPPLDYNTELENENGTGAGAFGENTFKTVLEQEEDRISFNENRDISKSNLVAVRIIIQNIREIDEIDEELTVDMDIILSWIDWDIFQANKDNAGEGDHKLIPTESLDPNTLQKIWKPDIFIENAVSIKKPKLISEPVKLLYSGSDGRFIYITRATVKTSCQMEFQYYPSDTQHCQVKIRSYSHSTEEITLNWDDTRGGVFIIDRDDNNFDVRISSVEQAKSIDAEDVAHLNFTNQYHLLEYTISARRKLSFHIIQTYLPSLFFVLITWLCFLIPSELFEARIGVTMTTLLTLTSMFSSVRENTPIVSYVRGIDIWMVACIYFVFLTLLEFTLLVCLRHRRNKQLQLKRKRQGGNSESDSNESRKNRREKSSQLSHSFTQIQKNSQSQPMQNIPVVVNIRRKSPILMRIQSFLGRRRKIRQAKDKVSDLIEKYSFISYSLLFVLFNIIYWPWLFIASEHFVWNVDSKYNGQLN